MKHETEAAGIELFTVILLKLNKISHLCACKNSLTLSHMHP